MALNDDSSDTDATGFDHMADKGPRKGSISHPLTRYDRIEHAIQHGKA